MIKKSFLSTALFLSATCLMNAQIFLAKTCETSFFSSSPLENIAATNKTAKPILNTSTGDLQVKIPIISFKFEKPLMEEHFNENYMETEKFPNAVFKGKINETIDYTKEGEYKVTVKGNLDMHGVIKEITLEGTVTVKGGQITLKCKFMVHIADYKIKVPSLYVKNIAEDVEVKLDAVLDPFQKK